jgi:hypothetical protein
MEMVERLKKEYPALAEMEENPVVAGIFEAARLLFRQGSCWDRQAAETAIANLGLEPVYCSSPAVVWMLQAHSAQTKAGPQLVARLRSSAVPASEWGDPYRETLGILGTIKDKERLAPLSENYSQGVEVLRNSNWGWAVSAMPSPEVVGLLQTVIQAISSYGDTLSSRLRTSFVADYGSDRSLGTLPLGSATSLPITVPLSRGLGMEPTEKNLLRLEVARSVGCFGETAGGLGLYCPPPYKMEVSFVGNRMPTSALKWNGWASYTLNDVSIAYKDRFVMEAEKATRAELVGIENAEVRRVAIAKFGAEALLEGAKPIDKTKWGELYEAEAWGRTFMILRVKNSTPEPDGSEKWYTLFARPQERTAKGAIARSFGLREHEYNPEAEA